MSFFRATVLGLRPLNPKYLDVPLAFYEKFERIELDHCLEHDLHQISHFILVIKSHNDVRLPILRRREFGLGTN